MRTFGTLSIAAPERRPKQDRPAQPQHKVEWLFDDATPLDQITVDTAVPMLEFQVEPHVAIRLRRLFPGARAQSDGVIALSATPANLHDIEWFLARYPVAVTSDMEATNGETPREWVANRAKEHAEEKDALLAILDGKAEARAIELALPPRDYQLRAAEIAHRAGGLLVADQLGLGKTLIGIALIVKAAADGGLPALVVVPPHLMIQWKREFEKFAPTISTHIIKTRAVYPVRADVLICSYFRLDGWRHHLATRVGTIVWDECQELRRKGTAKYDACEEVARGARWRLGLSATPIFNYGGEFWNVLNVLSPDCLGSWREFLEQWCGNYDEERKASLTDPGAFGAFLKEQLLMIRRTRIDVARELPPFTRAVETIDCDDSIMLEMEPKAIALAKAVLAKQGTPLEKLQAAQELSSLTRMATGLAKAGYVAEWVDVLCEESGEPVVLFGWHRSVWAAWSERLAHRGVAWHTGSESAVKKRKELDRFRRGDAQVLFMSLRSGAGVDGLQDHCHQVVFGELDWSPAVHGQAIGRVDRDGQRKGVMAYYLLARDSMDQVMADVLGLKEAQHTGVNDEFGKDNAPREIPKEHVKRLAEAVLARFGRGRVAG